MSGYGYDFPPGGGAGGGGIGGINAGTSSVTSGTIFFADSPTVSFGLNGQTITASAIAPASSLTNIRISAGTTNNLLSAFSFADGSGVLWGLNGSTITASVRTDYQSSNANYLTSQSNQNAVGSNGNFNFQTISFSNANGFSFGTSAGSAIFGSYTVPTVTNSSWTVSDSLTSGTVARLAFTNLNGITLSLSSGAAGLHTIVGSHNGLTSQSNQAFSAGAGSSTFQTLSFQDSNNFSFSNNGGAIRVTHHLAGTNTAITGNALITLNSTGLSFNGSGLAGTSTGFAGANISGSMTHNSAGLNLSLSVAAPGGGGAVNFSAGTTSNDLQSVVFSNSNGVSFGLNGSTITASVAAAAGITIPGYNPYDDFVLVTGQHGNGSLVIDPQFIPNVSCDRLVILLQNTNSSNSSGSHSLSFRFGLYTRNGNTLSLYTSYSGSTAITHSGTAGSYSLFSNQRGFPVTFGATVIPENRYWIGFVSSTSSAGANGSYSNYVVSNVNSAYAGLFGVAAAATMQPKLGQGYYTAVTNGMPNSIGFSEINGTASMGKRMVVIGFGSSTV